MRKPILRVLAFAALAALGWPEATASAKSVHSQGKGKGALASFTLVDTCAPGVTFQTYVSISATEQTIKMNGDVVNSLRTDVFVYGYNPCTNNLLYDFGTIYGGDLPMNALESASLVGHYVLQLGTVVDSNLTLTGTDQINNGHSMNRQTFGPVMLVIRENGSQRTSSVAGTVTINGRVITSSEMTDVSSYISRSTSSEMTVIQSGN